MIMHELSSNIYPWDIHDEGVDNLLDNIQNIAGGNMGLLAAMMHQERRPVMEARYPHNPVRKSYISEDARCYFTIHDDMYKGSRLKPLRAERDFLRDTDWLQVLTDALRKRGMRTGASITHTPLDAHRALTQFPELIQQDVFGNHPVFHYFGDQQLCWNNNEAREYSFNIAADIVKHYDIDTLMVSMLLLNPGEPDIHALLGVTLGGCFCPACEAKARAQGLDWDAIKKTVGHFARVVRRADAAAGEEWTLIKRTTTTPTLFLLQYPELYQWLKFRCDTISDYIRDMGQVVHAINPKLDFRYNTNWPKSEFFGFDLRRIVHYVDSIRVLDYAEQTGDAEAVMKKDVLIANALQQMGETKKPVIASVATRGKATPELIKQALRLIAKSGADGLSYAFYDCASFELLRALKEGAAEAGIVFR
ncbi:MAG: hypothetical protein LBV27_02305 [Oscillospiraceae bacterium]|jgi:hypothetical protein|nr:hypothetical protein [Oscillospiraceae bacterium]